MLLDEKKMSVDEEMADDLRRAVITGTTSATTAPSPPPAPAPTPSRTPPPTTHNRVLPSTAMKQDQETTAATTATSISSTTSSTKKPTSISVNATSNSLHPFTTIPLSTNLPPFTSLPQPSTLPVGNTLPPFTNVFPRVPTPSPILTNLATLPSPVLSPVLTTLPTLPSPILTTPLPSRPELSQSLPINSNTAVSIPTKDVLDMLIERSFDGQVNWNCSFRFGNLNQQSPTVTPPITTLKDLLIAIWDYCAQNPRVSVPILLAILSFLGYAYYPAARVVPGGANFAPPPAL